MGDNPNPPIIKFKVKAPQLASTQNVDQSARRDAFPPRQYEGQHQGITYTPQGMHTGIQNPNPSNVPSQEPPKAIKFKLKLPSQPPEKRLRDATNPKPRKKQRQDHNTFNPPPRPSSLATHPSQPLPKITFKAPPSAPPPPPPPGSHLPPHPHAPYPPQHQHQQGMPSVHDPSAANNTFKFRLKPFAPQKRRRGRPPGIRNGERARKEANEEVTYQIANPLPPRKQSSRAAILAAKEETLMDYHQQPGADLGVGEGGGGKGQQQQQQQHPTPPSSHKKRGRSASILSGGGGGGNGGGPPTMQDFLNLLTKIRKRDTSALFKIPVTEDVAPGYFEVVTHPMDMSTIESNVQGGSRYKTWDDVWKDLELMFDNALAYNEENSDIWSYANVLKDHAKSFLDAAKAGRTDFRSTAGMTRKLNAQMRAEERAKRDAARSKAKAEQRAALEKKVLRRAGVKDMEALEAQEPRITFRTRVEDVRIGRLRGLGAGANGEGISYVWGRPLIEARKPTMSAEVYSASMERYLQGLLLTATNSNSNCLSRKMRKIVEGKLGEANRVVKIPPPRKAKLKGGGVYRAIEMGLPPLGGGMMDMDLLPMLPLMRPPPLHPPLATDNNNNNNGGGGGIGLLVRDGRWGGSAVPNLMVNPLLMTGTGTPSIMQGHGGAPALPAKKNPPLPPPSK